jgi:beta-barrel assembly-enhancing protease
MKFPPLILALSLALTPTRASELPDLGEVSQTVFSAQEEEKVGATIMRDIMADPAFVDDPELTEYLNSLGYRLVAASPDNRRYFQFFAVRDPTFNAFALPGANIGIHTGLFTAVRNESELAGVLAHEIAHVTQKHLARMIAGQQQTMLPSLAALAVAILAARSNGQLAQAAIAAAQAGAIQTQLDYSREYEREADRVGLQILQGSDLDPGGMVSFFDRLHRQARLYENNAPAYLRTHPLTFERIADMQNRVEQLPARPHADSPEFSLLRARYEGLAYPAKEAVALFQSQLTGKNAVAARFGLVESLLRSNDVGGARQEFSKLESTAPPSPLVHRLGADLALASGRLDEGLQRYRRALQTFPDYSPLAYAYARALLNADRAPDALSFLEERLRLWPDDARLYELKADSHARMGNKLLRHQAQAEALLRRNNASAAIEQLELALKAGDGDFYQMSITESRLKELRARQKGQEARVH